MRERQSSGTGWEEEFGGYSSEDRRYAFKRSKGGQTVDLGAKDKGHYTLRQRIEKRFPVRVRCFQEKSLEEEGVGFCHGIAQDCRRVFLYIFFFSQDFLIYCNVCLEGQQTQGENLV